MAQNDQAEPAYCQYETERHGTKYRCVNKPHKGGGHDLKPLDEIPDALKTYFAKTTLDDLTDRGDLVPADPPSATDATVAKIVQRLARLAERKHHADQLAYEVDAGLAISSEIGRLDEERWADNLLADPTTLLRLKARVDAWVLQVGIPKDGDA